MVTSRFEVEGSSFVTYRKRGDGDWRNTGVIWLHRCHGRQRVTARREARPGQHGRRARRHAASTLRGDGGGDSGERNPPGAAGSLDADWLACAQLSACEAQRAADRIVVAWRSPLTALGLRQDVEAIWPHLRGEELTAAVVAVYRRLPARLGEQHDLAAHAGKEGGRR
jgi:hypothetical protein